MGTTGKFNFNHLSSTADRDYCETIKAALGVLLKKASAPSEQTSREQEPQPEDDDWSKF